MDEIRVPSTRNPLANRRIGAPHTWITGLHGAHCVVEAGLTFGATSDLQLDATGGIDIYTGSYFVGIGLARRWRWRGPIPEVARSP